MELGKVSAPPILEKQPAPPIARLIRGDMSLTAHLLVFEPLELLRLLRLLAQSLQLALLKQQFELFLVLVSVRR